MQECAVTKCARVLLFISKIQNNVSVDFKIFHSLKILNLQQATSAEELLKSKLVECHSAEREEKRNLISTKNISEKAKQRKNDR